MMRRFFGTLVLVFLCTPLYAATWYINPSGSGDAPTIRAGVDSAASGDTLLLANGTFTGPDNRDISYLGKALVITSENGRDSTIINCQLAGRGFIFENGEDSTAVLSGVTIKNGQEQVGGAVYVRISRPRILDNKFVTNNAVTDGGAIYWSLAGGASSTGIVGNIFRDNVAGDRGGGLFVQSSSPIVSDNRLVSNDAARGGGVAIQSSSAIFKDNIIETNTASESGGGMHCSGSSITTFTGTRIVGNSAVQNGGGVYFDISSHKLTDVLIARNTAGILGGGVYCWVVANPVFTNCTISGNGGGTSAGNIAATDGNPTFEKSIIAFATEGPAVQCFGSAAPVFTCSDLYGNAGGDAICGTDGGDNFSLDPLFCDVGTDDYTLEAVSPCTAVESPCGELVGAFMVGCPRSGSARFYVKHDAMGLGDGSSWVDAFPNVQAGLGVALDGDTVWVAAGTYVPTSTTDRMLSFVMKNGVVLVGGFAGTETLLEERDVDANLTILSGDIGAPGVADNSYHVVVGSGVDSTSVIDGFTITGGKADGDYPEYHGAGIRVDAGSPTFKNVTVTLNTAIGGAGMFAVNGSDPTFIDAAFVDNYSNEYGLNTGGGIKLDYSDATLTNVVLDGNSARLGGALYHRGTGTTRLINCLFINNLATDDGGTAGWGGCIYATSGGVINLTNVTMVGNHADGHGGGILNAGYGYPAFVNLMNSIVAGNTSPLGVDNIVNRNEAVTMVSYSLVRGSGGSGPDWDASVGVDVGYNVDADPLFVDEISGDLRLYFGSPAMEAGNNSAPDLPATDFDGGPRVLGAIVDMGAFETEIVCPPANIFYVDADATGAGNGSSWGDAFKTVPQALSMRSVCGAINEIWVAAGTYTPVVSGYQTETFTLRNGLALYGGFAGGETSLGERDITGNPTFLSGEIRDAGAGDNTYHVVTADGVDSTAVLDGFTVTAGNADGASAEHGAGLLLTSASPTIRNTIFADNSGEFGGAVHCNGGSPVFMDCRFVDNSGELGGAFAALNTVGARLVNAWFDGNNGNSGGAVYVQLGTVAIVNSLFYDNFVMNYGGGIYNVVGNVTVTNGTFHANTATHGGAISNNSASLAVTNSILWGDVGGEVYNSAGSAPVVSFSLVEASGGSGAGWNPAIGVDGGNNLDTDPLFVDAANADLHLGSGSLAIDSGDNNAPELAATDFDGLPRVMGGVVDMGAYEFDVGVGIVDPPITPTITYDTGIKSVYPNPFNPSTTISFELARQGHARVDIYDVRGSRVLRAVDDALTAGPHTFTWKAVDTDGRHVASGVYFARLEFDGVVDVRKIVLLK